MINDAHNGANKARKEDKGCSGDRSESFASFGSRVWDRWSESVGNSIDIASVVLSKKMGIIIMDFWC
jgi:hypothetical protein